jgi:HD-GYP domain-containing protein (c-di-GMP phosphodiesterase class II)
MVDKNKNIDEIMKSYKLKNVMDLIPGDIILHPIYRADGLMLIKQYTIVTAQVIAHIKPHLNNLVKMLVSESEEKFKTFNEYRVFTYRSFIEELNNIVEISKDEFKIPLKLNSFIDPRVNLNDLVVDEHFLRAKDIEENNMKHEKSTISEEANEFQNGIEAQLIALLSRVPLWEYFHTKLESENLIKRAMDIKEKIINFISKDTGLLSLSRLIRGHDDYIGIHAVNTLCLSVLIGLTLELSEEELIDLAIAALFCNIGYTKIKKEDFRRKIQNKDDLLTMKGHIKDSLEIISSCRVARKKSIIYAILEHHEDYSGKGFPVGKKGDNITLLGRILNIATSYDDMVGVYFENVSVSSNQAISIIWDNNDLKYDPDILKAFMHRTNIYKIGNVVMLSPNEKGHIIGFTNYLKAPHKPIVRLGTGEIIDYYTKKI